MEGLLGRLVTPHVFMHSKFQPSARLQVLLQPSPIPRTPSLEFVWKGKSMGWGQLQPNKGSEFQSLQRRTWNLLSVDFFPSLSVCLDAPNLSILSVPELSVAASSLLFLPSILCLVQVSGNLSIICFTSSSQTEAS